MKIFLVDKHPLVREFFEEFFKKSSHEVFQFSCAERALDVIDGMDFMEICRCELDIVDIFLS
jgi:DNA-binding response OmpR family regulator